jgi:hypothetical protein
MIMRRFLALTLCLTGIILSASGCRSCPCCCNSAVSTEKQTIESESRKPAVDETSRRGKKTDQPNASTPVRIHGGVGPTSPGS